MSHAWTHATSFESRCGTTSTATRCSRPWSPALAFAALQLDLTVGAKLPVTFAIYELADGETAIIAADRLSEAAAAHGWPRAAGGLSSIADDQGERIARVLERVLQVATRRPPLAPAA